ncbi:odorant receptor 49a-like [Pararge aegeria]|uniref:odorant receptor 49a-like n=1 Tax=Pararge aegeria TaxID=116150 RepID=UPI0019CF82DF|nr:odorant receptor 49a-like [Pararge aegeria]
MVKMFVLVLKRNEIEQVILEIGKLWHVDNENSQQNEEMNFWIRPLFGTVTLTIMVFTLVPLAITIYGCYTKNEAEYKFILEMYFFNQIDSHFKYLMAIVFQIVMCILCQMCIAVPCDYLLLDLSCDLAALIRMVQIDLLSLKGTANLENLNIGDVNSEDIKSIVKKHQILLSLTERLNNIFKEVIFSQVYLSSVVICCYLFTAMFQMSKYGVVSSLGDLVASMDILAKTFVLAVPGQIIADMSSGVADAAYQSLWYERSNKFRKFIAILIARAQKPSYLSALGFSNLSLVMFSKVASTSWSYLSLLNQMSENFDV